MAVKDAPYTEGPLEFFSDACGTLYGKDVGEATAQAYDKLVEAGYGPVQARLTAAQSVRFVGLAKHKDDGTESV